MLLVKKINIHITNTSQGRMDHVFTRKMFFLVWTTFRIVLFVVVVVFLT